MLEYAHNSDDNLFVPRGTEQIVVKLRQADFELGKVLKLPQVCKQLGISKQTY